MKRGIGFLIIGQVLLMAAMLAGAVADEWQMETARELEQKLQPLVDRE